tara:strand:+ start:2585 stop:4378 length:1794 start_codon:yes stop_codon:yes gene_type:complete
MAYYGNSVLTAEQIDELMGQGSVEESMITSFIIDDKDTNDPLYSTLGGRGGFIDIRQQWGEILIHFNNFLHGNDGSIYSSALQEEITYSGNKYLDVRDLEIYVEVDGSPQPRMSAGNSVLKLKPKADRVMRRYKAIWSNEWLQGTNPDNDGDSDEVWGNDPVVVSVYDTDSFYGGGGYNTSVDKLQDFTDATRPLGTWFILNDEGVLDEWQTYKVWSRLVALHTSLYGHIVGSNIARTPMKIAHRPFIGDVPGPIGTPLDAAKLFKNVIAGVDYLWDTRDQQADWAAEYNTAQQNEILEEVGFEIGTLPSSVKQDLLLANSEFKRFFSNSFNNELTAVIPLIYNFYLTSEYFAGVGDAFQTPKDRALDIIISTIANDNNFDATPNLSRPAANSAVSSATGQDQQAGFNSSARDFILKMIIKTPIDILKGLVELVDPHVAISKVIKTGSGFAFNQAIGALDQVIQTSNLNEEIANATENVIQPNLNGEDLLTLLLCIVDYGIKQGMEEAAEGPPPLSIPENFFPRVSVDGIDFTGTVSGMLMMPPSPLGLIYLLLELLKSDVTNQTENVSNANTESADAVECTPEPQNLLSGSCDDTE